MLNATENLKNHHATIASTSGTDDYMEFTALNFPRPILMHAAVGDVLQLHLNTMNGKTGVLALYHSQVAGFASLHGQEALLESMKHGDRYEAVIRRNYGTYCHAQVRPMNHDAA